MNFDARSTFDGKLVLPPPPHRHMCYELRVVGVVARHGSPRGAANSRIVYATCITATATV